MGQDVIYTTPSEIERESMRIIAGELARMGVSLPPEREAVVKRVIHTTADFDYVQNLRFTEGAVERASSAFRAGAAVVTDTNMAKSGVSKAALDKLGGGVYCFMADPDVAREAKDRGVTRAVVCMEKAAREHPGAVLAVGNAPTALLKLCELMENGLRPALVVGAPVGFVNVEESKRRVFEVCLRYDVPCIAAMGRKGGSNAAAAICNAILYTALDAVDLSERQKRLS